MTSADISPPDVSGNTVSPQAYVYVIAAESGEVKVGIAKDTLSRLRGLQTAHSRKLSIAYEIACFTRAQAYAFERRAHALLEASALEGEWFAVSPEQARDAVEQAIRDEQYEQRRKEEAAKGAPKAAEVLTYLGPQITEAPPWMREPCDIMKFVLAQEGGSERKYLFDFGDCVVFAGCRRESETGENFFFINDVTRWHMRDENGEPCNGATANNPLGNPPCALFATVLEPSKVVV